jgi:ATP-binding cassette, subfamily B, bacterial MsbA
MITKYFKLPPGIRSFLKATNFWKGNAFIFRELKHLRRLAILAIVFSLVSALMAGTTLGLIGAFLQGLTNPNEPALKTGMGWFDIWFLATQASASERILRLSILILVAIWIQSLLLYFGTLHSSYTALGLSDRLRKRVFEQLQSLSLSYYSKVRAGELMNSLRGEVNQIQQAFDIISIFITQGSTLLVYFITMFLLSWQLTLASIAIFGLLAVGIAGITRRVREASFAVPKANQHFTSVSLEFINGIRTVHASATQEFERKRFRQAAQQVYQADKAVADLSKLVQPLSQGVSSTALILMVVVAFNLLVGKGQLPPVLLLTFLFALSRTLPIVSLLNAASSKLSSFQGSLHSVGQLLRRDNKPYLKDGKVQFEGLKRSIDFVSVDFGYDPNEPVLHNITLSIQQGQTTALVGASGAGKTTLADLIPRFYDPTQGEILIDGINLREFDINSLRRRMAIVSQDTFIFNATALYNIGYGLEEIDESLIYEVARQANALEFIQELPDGFNTKLGDRGIRLSGGQRQRIAIARALLRNPEILILDEATSALDSVTERLIQESLEKLAEGRTVIAIAHRLSTISGADKVVVLEQGKIVEQGQYQELLEKQGKLWKYHQIQYSR